MTANSYLDGYTDGELAAITHLPSRRVHARATMADPYDPLWAQGLIDGYLHATAVNTAHTDKTPTNQPESR
ncbi:hypothetical protein [Streptomyces sp. AD55]|uniref:hypothetical protein n=1 Tax=Streptomyces sp. AD55 TaxID=3242895 RepID=UPI0035279141